jgi:hypothetical protein
MRQLLSPKNIRLKRPICCATCRFLSSDMDSWFCTRPEGPRWTEIDEQFWHTCDLWQPTDSAKRARAIAEALIKERETKNTPNGAG